MLVLLIIITSSADVGQPLFRVSGIMPSDHFGRDIPAPMASRGRPSLSSILFSHRLTLCWLIPLSLPGLSNPQHGWILASLIHPLHGRCKEPSTRSRQSVVNYVEVAPYYHDRMYALVCCLATAGHTSEMFFAIGPLTKPSRYLLLLLLLHLLVLFLCFFLPRKDGCPSRVT
ncbi:hypothetical protein VUR80DRAFT_2983 [Thermomyces stellatus]